MIFLALLLGSFLVVHVVARRRLATPDRWRVALAIAMAVAGMSHLADPTPFVQHLPTWVPDRGLLVLATGLLEIGLGGALLLPQPHRRTAGLVLAAYLVLVFPANVHVAVAGVEVDGQPGGLYPWLRLPWQILYVWLAHWATRPDHGPAVDEPTVTLDEDRLAPA